MDQAFSLREQMLEQLGRGEVPKVIHWMGADPLSGTTSLIWNAADQIHETGFRVAVIDFGDSANQYSLPLERWEELLFDGEGVDWFLSPIKKHFAHLSLSRGSQSGDGFGQRLARLIDASFHEFDAVLIDWSSFGVNAMERLTYSMPSHHFLALVTRGERSEREGERIHEFIKSLYSNWEVRQVGLIQNFSRSGRESMGVYRELTRELSRLQELRISYLGHCFDDQDLEECMNKGEFLLQLRRESVVTHCLELISKRVLQWTKLTDELGLMKEGYKVLVGRGRFREELARRR